MFKWSSIGAALVLAACGAPTLPDEASQSSAQISGDSSVVEHHNDSMRSGVFVHPAFTRQAAAGIRLAFRTPINGVVTAQPLFLDGHERDPDRVLVATMQNEVSAIDASSGRILWRRVLEPPLPRRVLQDTLAEGCGMFDPIGISGTPVIDRLNQRIYFNLLTGDPLRHSKHLVYGLALRDGSTLPGWPVDVSRAVPAFRDIVQSQRGALTLLHDRVYVPYGAHTDCGDDYQGWLVGISTSNPASVGAWSTRVQGGGAAIWAASGVASDGTSLFVATGNGTESHEWNGSEAIIRLREGPSFSGLPADYFAPRDWESLDIANRDLGGSGVTLFDLPRIGMQLALALGKDGKMYLADRMNLGGIGGARVTETVSTGEIITSPSVYTTSEGTYVAFSAFRRGINCPGNETVSSIKILATSPLSISTAWCAAIRGYGSTLVTTTDGRAESIVWVVGTGSDSLLHGFHGDTGQSIAQIGGAGSVGRYMAPIAAKGGIYVAARNALVAFALPSGPVDGGTHDGGGFDGGLDGGLHDQLDGGRDDGGARDGGVPGGEPHDGGSLDGGHADRGSPGGEPGTGVRQPGCSSATGGVSLALGAILLAILIRPRSQSSRLLRRRNI